MKILGLSLLSYLVLCTCVFAQITDDFAKAYDTTSVYYSVPDNTDKPEFADLDFRFGWNNKAPYVIGIQFANRSYANCKFKFAIKDTTSKKTVILDTDHNTGFAQAAVSPTSNSGTWSGAVDDPKDSFSLVIWDADGNEYDKVPISIADQQ